MDAMFRKPMQAYMLDLALRVGEFLDQRQVRLEQEMLWDQAQIHYGKARRAIQVKEDFEEGIEELLVCWTWASRPFKLGGTVALVRDLQECAKAIRGVEVATEQWVCPEILCDEMRARGSELAFALQEAGGEMQPYSTKVAYWVGEAMAYLNLNRFDKAHLAICAGNDVLRAHLQGDNEATEALRDALVEWGGV